MCPKTPQNELQLDPLVSTITTDYRRQFTTEMVTPKRNLCSSTTQKHTTTKSNLPLKKKQLLVVLLKMYSKTRPTKIYRPAVSRSDRELNRQPTCQPTNQPATQPTIAAIKLYLLHSSMFVINLSSLFSLKNKN